MNMIEVVGVLLRIIVWGANLGMIAFAGYIIIGSKRFNSKYCPTIFDTLRYFSLVKIALSFLAALSVWYICVKILGMTKWATSLCPYVIFPATTFLTIWVTVSQHELQEQKQVYRDWYWHGGGARGDEYEWRHQFGCEEEFAAPFFLWHISLFILLMFHAPVTCIEWLKLMLIAAEFSAILLIILEITSPW